MTTKSCRTCGGTGWIYSRRSWFTADGYDRSRCPICAGSGEHSFIPDARYERFQRDARKALTRPADGAAK